jgi:hypothetical protein
VRPKRKWRPGPPGLQEKEKRGREMGRLGNMAQVGFGFERSFAFSSFWIKFEFESNSIESYMNSNTKHSTIQNKMQAAWNATRKYLESLN